MNRARGLASLSIPPTKYGKRFIAHPIFLLKQGFNSSMDNDSGGGPERRDQEWEFDFATSDQRKPLIWLFMGGVIFLGGYLLQEANYLLFHSLAEMVSIVIASGVFIITWNSRKRIANNFVMIIGVSYGSIATLDLIHSLSYAGMGVFPGYGANLPTELWIGARFVEALSLVVGAIFVAKSTLSDRVSFGQDLKSDLLLLSSYGIITALVLGSIFRGVFPDAYIEGVGLTQFKILSEYVIIGLLVIALGLLYQNRDVFEKRIFRYLGVAIVLTIGAEFMFTLYLSVYGISNMLGHLLKLSSFYFIYVAVIKTGIREPQRVLFRQLAQERHELAARTDELERQNARLDQFASFVSHDLRNPLNVAQGRLELARESTDSSHLDEAATAIDRSLALIEDMLSLARAGRHVSEKETVELQTLIESCWNTVDTAEAQIEADIDLSIRADRSRLRQLVENLIRNAVDHGGEDVTVRIGSLTDGFFIEDDGPGIPPEKRDQVFESEYSIDEKGTGFGLSIVQQIVDSHGWNIQVTESAEGGARFEISDVEVVAE